MMIIAGFAYIAIPEKPWWLFVGIIVVGYLGFWITKNLPREKLEDNVKPPE